jgi:hypothetical protein
MQPQTFTRTGAALLVATLAVACEHAPMVPDVQSLFAISDGAHGGNLHFYWLPPLVPEPNATGVFDATLSPVVRICEWDGTSCTLVLAEYTRNTGPGSETVRLVSEDEHYIVKWHTNEFALDADATYQIEALVDGFVLGTAGVDVVSNGGAMKNVDTDEWIAMPDGRTLPIRFRIEEGAVPSSFSSTSVALDGVDDAVDMGQAHTFFGVEALSLSLWFRTSSTGSEQHLMGQQNPGFNRRGYFIHLDADGHVCFSLVANELSLKQRECTRNVPAIGEWHHVVATLAAGTRSFAASKLYVDGVEATTVAIGQDLGNNSFANSGGLFTVGAAICSGACSTIDGDPVPLGQPFDGLIDEAALYVTELTAPQVAAIYNGGSPPDLTAVLLPAGWWRMGECTDVTSTLVCDDGTGVVINGTLTHYPATLLNGATFSADTPSDGP